MAAHAMVQVPRNLASNLNFSKGGEEAAETWVPGKSLYFLLDSGLLVEETHPALSLMAQLNSCRADGKQPSDII